MLGHKSFYGNNFPRKKEKGNIKEYEMKTGGENGTENVEENLISPTDCHPCFRQLSCTPEWDGKDAVFPGIALMQGTVHAWQRHSSVDLVLFYHEHHKDLFQHTPEDKRREKCRPFFPKLIWVPRRVIYMTRDHKTMQPDKIQIQCNEKKIRLLSFANYILLIF